MRRIWIYSASFVILFLAGLVGAPAARDYLDGRDPVISDPDLAERLESAGLPVLWIDTDESRDGSMNGTIGIDAVLDKATRKQLDVIGLVISAFGERHHLVGVTLWMWRHDGNKWDVVFCMPTGCRRVNDPTYPISLALESRQKYMKDGLDN